MTRTTRTPPPRVPVRTRRAAHAIAWCAAPSGLWRLAMASGIYVGYSDKVLRDDYAIPGWGVAYVVGLSVLTELAALFPLLLVRDRRPRYPRALARLAWTASAVTMLVALSQVVVAFTVRSRTDLASGTPRTVWAFAYAPLLAVPVLLTAVTWSYARRLRAEGEQ
ncbi:hypothetical protein [Streptomyces fodineus]|nr:hypothetical protein [Streptomyces fodineus]